MNIQELCKKQAQNLQNKSVLVESAANELIHMLMVFEDSPKEEEEKNEEESCSDSKATDRLESEGKLLLFLLSDQDEEDTGKYRKL